MAKQRYVVRVVIPMELPNGEANPLLGLIECLRYAGTVKVHEVQALPDTKCFDILPPKGVAETDVWAEHNGNRMHTFGFNAVKAPEVIGSWRG